MQMYVQRYKTLYIYDAGHMLGPSPGDVASCKIDVPDACGILNTLANDWNIQKNNNNKQTAYIW